MTEHTEAAAVLRVEVGQLLPRLERDPAQPLPSGASDQELDELTARVDTPLPDELTAWLRICKGAAIGPGGVFGARPDSDFLDLAVYLDEYPTWRADGWFPIAGDGTGNYYVLLTKGPQAGFIGFIEAVVDPDRLDYLVASNLWSFLRFLFRRDLGARGWPFDRATVLADDPHLADAPAKLQPWNT
jgi:cell wall assembly regulator SMI1